MVEARRGTLVVDGRGEDEEKEDEEATNIKSNNPHLAGGEKHGNPKSHRDAIGISQESHQKIFHGNHLENLFKSQRNPIEIA